MPELLLLARDERLLDVFALPLPEVLREDERALLVLAEEAVELARVVPDFDAEPVLDGVDVRFPAVPELLGAAVFRLELALDFIEAALREVVAGDFFAVVVAFPPVRDDVLRAVVLFFAGDVRAVFCDDVLLDDDAFFDAVVFAVVLRLLLVDPLPVPVLVRRFADADFAAVPDFAEPPLFEVEAFAEVGLRAELVLRMEGLLDEAFPADDAFLPGADDDEPDDFIGDFDPVLDRLPVEEDVLRLEADFVFVDDVDLPDFATAFLSLSNSEQSQSALLEAPFFRLEEAVFEA